MLSWTLFSQSQATVLKLKFGVPKSLGPLGTWPVCPMALSTALHQVQVSTDSATNLLQLFTVASTMEKGAAVIAETNVVIIALD